MTDAPMRGTLLLDTQAWDLCLDARGNWAFAAPPYAVIQAVASACKLFLGELYFDTTKGVPYFADVLGEPYPLGLIKSDLIEAALSVPGVSAAVVYLDAIVDRHITGQIQVETPFGQLLVGL
jgi:hypothetical protein